MAATHLELDAPVFIALATPDELLVLLLSTTLLVPEFASASSERKTKAMDGAGTLMEHDPFAHVTGKVVCWPLSVPSEAQEVPRVCPAQVMLYCSEMSAAKRRRSRGQE